MAKKKSALVLVDGENFFHQVLHLLKKDKHIKHRREITKFDLRGLTEQIIGHQENVEIRYFTTRLKLVKENSELKKLSQDIISQQRMWKRNLQRQNIQYIAAGSLKVRDARKCKKCNNRDRILQEKGVDVRLAVDLLLAAQSGTYSEIYLISSDTDLLPALVAANAEKKAKLTYIATAYDINFALYYACKSVLTFTGEQVGAAFKRVNTDG